MKTECWRTTRLDHKHTVVHPVVTQPHASTASGANPETQPHGNPPQKGTSLFGCQPQEVENPLPRTLVPSFEYPRHGPRTRGYRRPASQPTAGKPMLMGDFSSPAALDMPPNAKVSATGALFVPLLYYRSNTCFLKLYEIYEDVP